MKTILIATDFSSASRNASLYGVALAQLLGAKIILCNAYEIPKQLPSINFGISPLGVMQEIQQKLSDEIKIISQGHDLRIESICDPGPADEIVNRIAQEKHADFIIIGMTGKGKNIKKVFGSNATSLSKNTQVPLLVVPEGATFSKPEKILYASDIPLDTNIEQIDQIKFITDLFGSKLYVVRMVKNTGEEIFERLNPSPMLRKELHILETTFEYPVGTDITNALSQFIEVHDVDILAMMPHKHTWVERLFKKSETKHMIFHTHIPLFVLPEIGSKFKTPSLSTAVSTND